MRDPYGTAEPLLTLAHHASKIPLATFILASVLFWAPQARADDKFFDDPFCDRDFIEMRKSGYIYGVRHVGRIYHFDGRHRRDLHTVVLVDEFQWYAAESKTNLVLLVKCQFDWDPVWNWHKTEFRSSLTNELL